jgi:hypothetical protein
MRSLVLYPILTTVLYFLGARATITKFLWSRYSGRLDAFMTCAACSGFWYGLLVAAVFRWPFLGLPGGSVLTVGLVAAASIFWTPILAHWHIRALVLTSGTVPEGE